jgi:NodT family efflux transporter outer membrane factor (OMF) lipoprotein
MTEMNYIYIKHALLAAGALLLMGLPSCQVVNKYHTPDVDLDGLYRGEQPEDTTSIASMPWNHYFTDTCLQDLIAEGLQQNHDLRMAYTRIQQAEVSLLIARSAYFPTVAIAGQATHSVLSEANGKKDVLGYSSNQFRLGVAAQWELDIWGKINRQGRAAYARYLSSEAYRTLIQTSLIANIANSYYSLLALDEQLVVTKESILLLEESAATMQSLMDAGLLNAAAVEQSKALLYNTQISVPGLESRIRQLENSLSVMLGRQPGSIERLNIGIQTVPTEMKHGIPAQLLSHRPDVMQAELAFRSAFEMKNAAQAALYPSITLSSGSMIGYGAATLSNFFRPENLLANIVGGLTQPLFAGNQLRGQVKIAKAQQEEALLNFEKTVLTAGQEVSDILYSFESSQKKNVPRSQQIRSLLTSVEFTKELLKAGEANYTEVLTAEQNLLQAQLGQVTDKLEQIQAVVNLYRALGGGTQ